MNKSASTDQSNATIAAPQICGRGERGFISLDFIFALSIAIGFSLVFFTICYTLAMVEVSQYVAFASSRAYSGAHLNEQLQRENGLQKFNQIMSQRAMRKIYDPDMAWIRLGEPEFGDFSNLYPSASAGLDPDLAIFVGARLPFESKVLKLRVPFLGSTVEKSSAGTATLNSYLMREVTTVECIDNFNRQRWSAIRNLNQNYSAAAGTNIAVITDNGC